MSGFWKVCSFLWTQYLVGPPFAWITASMRRGMKAISLWHCLGVMEVQVALIVAFRSSELFKSSLTVETSHWTSSNMDSVPLFLQTLGPWFPNEMQNLLSSEKRTVDHWVTVQLFFSLAQVRCFWRCFCFRSGLVALLLKMSERGDSWCTDSSFSSLFVKLSQVFESALLDSILKLAVIPVACAHFTTQFLPSSQLCI